MRTTALICSLVISALFRRQACGQNYQVGSFIDDDDLARCEESMGVADKDNDKRLSSDEYSDFVDLYSNGEIVEDNFEDLPIRLILIFNWIACFCTMESNADFECCVQDNAGIILDSTSEDQSQLLFCAQTSHAIGSLTSNSPHPTPSTQAPQTSPSTGPLAPSSTPNLYAFPTGTPSIPSSFSPTVTTSEPTLEGLLCVRFQYSLRNELNLTASDIFNEVNNTLMSRLIIATGITVIDILNASFVQKSLLSYSGNEINGDSEMPDLSHVVTQGKEDDIPSNSTPSTLTWDGRRRLYATDRFAQNVEFILVETLGGNQVAYDLVQQEMEEWMQNPILTSQLDHRRALTFRKLVFYSEDIPATIDSISEGPLVLCPGGPDTDESRCSIISSTVCVILGPDDDAEQVRSVLVRGLAQAIDSGEFESNIPPEGEN